MPLYHFQQKKTFSASVIHSDFTNLALLCIPLRIMSIHVSKYPSIYGDIKKIPLVGL